MTQSNFGTIVATTKSGAGLASDLNAWRDAVHSSHKGAATPTYKVAGLTWINDVNVPWEDYVWDGAVNTLRGFIDPVAHRYSTAGNFAKSVTAGAVAKLADWGTLFNLAGAAAQTIVIDPKSSLLPGWWIRVVARNVAATINPYTSETIDGATTKLMSAGSSCTIFYDGSQLYTDQNSGGLTEFPVGGVVHVPAINPPNGFLRLNGASLSRVTYSALWGFAQVSGNMVTEGAWTEGKFSSGDGLNTFRIPDQRGRFIRSWDNSHNVDAGRLIGTLQDDDFQSHGHVASSTIGGSAHNHTFSDTSNSAGSHTHSITGVMPLNGPAYTWGFDWVGSGSLSDTTPNTNAAGAHTHAIGGTTSTHTGHTHPITVNAYGGTETRPKNVALLACIKY